MSLLKLIVVGASAALLAACAQQPTVPIEHYNNVLITMPKSVLMKCVLTPPPDPDAYVKATPDEREKMLMAALTANMVNIHICNTHIEQGISWEDKTIQQYTTDPSTIFVGRAPEGAASGVAAPGATK